MRLPVLLVFERDQLLLKEKNINKKQRPWTRSSQQQETKQLQTKLQLEDKPKKRDKFWARKIRTQTTAAFQSRIMETEAYKADKNLTFSLRFKLLPPPHSIIAFKDPSIPFDPNYSQNHATPKHLTAGDAKHPAGDAQLTAASLNNLCHTFDATAQ